MLNNIRNFAKTKYATVLVAILIVPFVLWGMGGLFSGGNKNNIAKINKENISTTDFQNYLNNSNTELDLIRENIDNNSIEELLADLISMKMLDMEIEDLNLIVSDKVLNRRIKENINFLDENNKFSRIKYEKFLLSSNITAPQFEYRLRQNELKKNLFNYISGGIHSPFFLINKNFNDQTKKISLDYINLTNFYKNKENFSDEEITKFIKENEDNLKEKSIDFKYSKISPKSLIGIDEFNNMYFEKIDELENDILNGVSLNDIEDKYKLKIDVKQNFKIEDEDLANEFYKIIYANNETNKIELLDKNDFYVLYEVTDIKMSLPNIKSEKFINKIKDLLFNKSKFEFNNSLMTNIGEKKFSQSDFDKLAKNNLSTINIDSISNDKKFTLDSVKFIYTRSKGDFALVSDKDKNIYLIKVIDIINNNISKTSQNFLIYKNLTNDKIKNDIYSSYDLFINDKYDIQINEKTLERVKNYFR